MPELRPAVVIYTKNYVDPTFLYGLSLDVPVVVVDGSGGKIRVNRLNTTVYSKQDISLILGKSKFQYIPNSSMIGFAAAQAAKEGYDPIITVEDNCVIPKSFVEFYIKALTEGPQNLIETNQDFLNTIGLDNFFPRDFPFTLRVAPMWEAKPVSSEDRHVIAHMGLWRGILDAAPTNKKLPDRVAYRNYSAYTNGIIPISFANFAVRQEAIACMMPISISNNKASDVLAGIVAQRIISKTKYLVTVGKPTVNRVSMLQDSLETTVASVVPEFVEWVDAANAGVKKDTITNMYGDLAQRLQTIKPKSPLAKSIFASIPQTMLNWVEFLQATS